ncbi:unnamed protein product [Urochloa humidicola]
MGRLPRQSCSLAELIFAAVVLAGIGALFSMVSVNKINPFPTPEPPTSPRNTRLLPPHARASAAQSHAPPPLSHLPPLRLNPLCGRTFDLQLASPPLALAHPKRSVQLHVPPSTSTLLLSFLPPRTPLSAAAVTLGSPSAGIPPVLAPLLRAMLGVAVQTGRPACRPESSTAAIGFLSEHGARVPPELPSSSCSNRRWSSSTTWGPPRTNAWLIGGCWQVVINVRWYVAYMQTFRTSIQVSGSFIKIEKGTRYKYYLICTLFGIKYGSGLLSTFGLTSDYGRCWSSDLTWREVESIS